MKTALCITMMLASLLSAVPGQAQEWTKEKAVEEFREMFAHRMAPEGQRPTAEQMKARATLFLKWANRIVESKIDLEEMDILLPFAHYISANATSDPGKARAAAGKELAEVFLKHGEIPAGMKEFEGFLDRTLGRQIFASIQADKYDRARKLINMYFDYAGPQYAYITSIGKELLAKNTGGSTTLLAEMLAQAMQSDTFTAEEKNNIMLYIYSGNSGSGAVATVSFVPFKATTMEGKEIAVEDFKGEVLLIDFWATWCGPCIEEMPHVVEAYKKYKDKGLEVIGVSLDQPNSKEKIRAMEKKLGMTWQQIYDGKFYDARIARMNNINSIPNTFLIDRSGRARYQGLRGEELHQKIEELLNEKPAPQTRGKSPNRR